MPRKSPRLLTLVLQVSEPRPRGLSHWPEALRLPWQS